MLMLITTGFRRLYRFRLFFASAALTVLTALTVLAVSTALASDLQAENAKLVSTTQQTQDQVKGQKTPQYNAPKKPVTLIIIGDSLTAGYGIAKEAAYPGVLQKLFERDQWQVRVINAGISGATSSISLEKHLNWQMRSKPTHMLLALGANDGLQGKDLAETEKNLDKMILLARKKGLTVFMAGVKIPPNFGQEYFASFAEIFKRLSQKHNVPLLPFLLEGVAGNRALNIPDGIHPNEKGHQKMAAHVHGFLQPLLGQPPGREKALPNGSPKG